LTYKFVQAKYYTKTNGRTVRLQVIHDMEFPEKATAAEDVANFFKKGPPSKGSAHYCHDNDSTVQCVLDKDVANAAPGANHDGLHHELAGYAKQTADDWRDTFSTALLARTAVVVHEKCVEYGNQQTWLSDAEIAAGKSGICDHAAISRVYRRSTHTDPGPFFPKDYFVDLVRAVPFLSNAPQGVIMKDAVAGLQCPIDGGYQKLQADGGVFNTNGCGHFHGSYASIPEPQRGDPNFTRRFTDIIRVLGGDGTNYVLLSTMGEIYDAAPFA
jgi:hypothetical protein